METCPHCNESIDIVEYYTLSEIYEGYLSECPHCKKDIVVTATISIEKS